ncbi:DUF4956 domain-containing protein [Methanospirillum lacunae]|uniref:DUF4956 domain-containing protein n=1 Tax=Methanospirillum lacunae TaxID=668570 RepID=A0A2V2N6P0_9EURY|nr:DUF4956 domain-containing protein [Methanospirillum lacunae]PWR72148.1 DUF4956 domain-containing protein [Methanospirillum lacunae]
MVISDSVLFVAGMVINLIFSLIIVRGIYYPHRRAQDYVFTFMAFSVVVYLIMGLFTSVELSIGAGFGLFALFSVLRYRTDTVPIREMTYLFVIIALPILNSILFGSGQYVNMVLSNLMIILVLWILEKKWGFRYEQCKLVRYERIELVRADMRDELIADIRDRTGLPVTKVEVIEMDYLRDSADLMISYDENAPLVPKDPSLVSPLQNNPDQLPSIGITGQ